MYQNTNYYLKFSNHFHKQKAVEWHIVVPKNQRSVFENSGIVFCKDEELLVTLFRFSANQSSDHKAFQLLEFGWVFFKERAAHWNLNERNQRKNESVSYKKKRNHQSQ